MKTSLKIEHLALFALGVFTFSQTGVSWWWFIGLFFLPDLSMLGYVVSPKLGAITYNIAHHFATAILIYLLGFLLNEPSLKIAGIILFSHSAFDRIFGYGLKYPDRFENTHLGIIGKKSQ